MLAAGRGDREAFADLVERHHRGLLDFIGRFLGTRDACAPEDLAQDVFLAVWRAAQTYLPQPGISTRSWLLRIAANACLNYRRGRALRSTNALDADSPAAATSQPSAQPGWNVEQTERIARVRGAVAALPPMQRAAVLLRHYHGLSYGEIAEALEASLPAVESLLFRARQTLRTALSAEQSRLPPQVSRKVRVECP